MGLSVIGAGFGRTGTESMKQALETLGYGPCYHMHEVLPHQDRVDTWRAAAGDILPDWDITFAGYRSTVDWPGARYWRELSVHFPDAKILLTTRSPESWYESMQNTILKVIRESTDPLSIATGFLARGVFGGNIDDRDHVIGVYERNIADVQAAFGNDRLLTYHLGDGWDPLCRFLDCPVPDTPYPHSNRPGEFHSSLDRVERARKEPGS